MHWDNDTGPNSCHNFLLISVNTCGSLKVCTFRGSLDFLRGRIYLIGKYSQEFSAINDVHHTDICTIEGDKIVEEVAKSWPQLRRQIITATTQNTTTKSSWEKDQEFWTFSKEKMNIYCWKLMNLSIVRNRLINKARADSLQRYCMLGKSLNYILKKYINK